MSSPLSASRQVGTSEEDISTNFLPFNGRIATASIAFFSSAAAAKYIINML